MLNREILFRGQIRKKGQKVNMASEKLPGIWVYGGIFPGTGDYSIIYGENHENLSVAGLGKHVVWSDTVGQFTGLTDKDGKRIFEGDIARCVRTGCDGKEMVGIIIFKDCCFCIKENKSINQPAMDLCDDFEVIGNIHDNPELLEADHGR